MHVTVRPLSPADQPIWAILRRKLWPECADARNRHEMASILADSANQAVMFAVDEDGGVLGFVETSIHPHALGCDATRVGYVEGWYVEPEARRRGVGRALLSAAEDWARAQGCAEMASDCHDHNQISFAAHLASGYESAGKLIHFRKRLTRVD